MYLDQRKLCYSGDIYYFTIPTELQLAENWSCKYYKVTIAVDPILITFQDTGILWGNFKDPLKKDPQVIKVAYGPLRVPKKLYDRILLPAGVNQQSYFHAEFSEHPRIATFRLLDPEEVKSVREYKEEQRLSDFKLWARQQQNERDRSKE